MKISCDVIGSLLPLYVDDLASDDSVELVKEHLESCEKCKEKLKELTECDKVEYDLDNIAYQTMTKVKKSYHWVGLNYVFLTLIFLAGFCYNQFFGQFSVGFMSKEDVEYGVSTNYRYNFEVDNYVQIGDASSIEEIENIYEKAGLVFDESCLVEDYLNLKLSGSNFNSINTYKVGVENSTQSIYYIEMYKGLFEQNTEIIHRIYNTNYIEKDYVTLDDYVAAVYIATPEEDILIYGDDVATEKFAVKGDRFGFNIFVAVLFVVSFVLAVVRFLGKNISHKNKDKLNILTLCLGLILPLSIFMLRITDIGNFGSYNLSFDNYININGYILIAVTMVLAYIGYYLYRLNFTMIESTHYKNIVWFTLACVGVIYFEKYKIFGSRLGWNNNIYWYYQAPCTIVIILAIIVLGIKLHNFDKSKPKQTITLDYKITQAIVLVYGVAIQWISVHIYNYDFNLEFFKEMQFGKNIFLELTSIADIISMSSSFLMLYALYVIIMKRQYIMVGVLIQTIAISSEKIIKMDIVYGNMDDPSRLTLSIFILFYLTLALSIVYAMNLKRLNSK